MIRACPTGRYPVKHTTTRPDGPGLLGMMSWAGRGWVRRQRRPAWRSSADGSPQVCCEWHPGILEILLGFWTAQQYLSVQGALLLVWVGLFALFRGISEIVIAFEVRSRQRG